MPLGAAPLILMSSDMRPKYIEDVFHALAAPSMSVIKFRYETRYLPQGVLSALSSDGIRDQRALIVFRGQVEGSTIVVPVRWCKVISTRRIADFVVINLLVGGYPVLTSQCGDGTLNTLLHCSETYFARVAEGLRDYPVSTAQLDFVAPDESTDTDDWLKVVKLLSFHDALSGLHFLRIGKFGSVSHSGDMREEGLIEVDEESYIAVPVEFYAEQYGGEETLSVSTDPDIIRLASGGVHSLRSRYDSLAILLHIRAVEGKTRTDLMFTLYNSGRTREFGFTVPISIARRPLRYWRRMIVPTVGALLVALQGFLDPNVDVRIKAMTVVAGALMIGASNLRK